MRSDKQRLLDIFDAIVAIEKYTCQGRDVFNSQELIQTWAIHHLQILGEAASGLSDNFKQQHDEIPWYKIIGMRNILVHGYFGIDTDVVWATVKNELPQLKEKVNGLIEQF